MEQRSATSDGSLRSESFGAAAIVVLRQTCGMVWRRKLLFCAVLALVYGLGALYYHSREFVYESQASVLVHRTGDSSSARTADVMESPQDYLPTHVRLMTSSAVLNRAVEKLKSADGPSTSQTPQQLASGLKVSYPKDTEILEISYRTADRRSACRVVQAVVSSYQEFVNETHRSTSMGILQILTQQKEDVDRQLSAKEAQLLALQQKEGVLRLPDDKNDVAMSRLTALNQAFSQARLRRLETEARYQALLTAIARGDPCTPFLSGHLDQVEPGVIARKLSLEPANDLAQREALRKEIEQDRLELQRLADVYGPNYPRVKLLERRVDLAKQALAPGDHDRGQRAQAEWELQVSARRLWEDELREAIALEKKFQDQLDKEKTQVVEHNVRCAPFLALETELNRLRSLYEALVQHIGQLHLGGDFGVINVQVIEPPAEPVLPVSPDQKKVVKICTGIGLLLALGLCYLFECWQAGYRGPEELADHLGLPVLGHIPILQRARQGRPRELIMRYPADWPPVQAEAFRGLRTTLLLRDPPPRKISIASPEPGDGKTLVLTNLAVSFAQSGLRTLVIESDMRRPRLREIFRLPAVSGLSLLLAQSNLVENDIAAAIQQTGVSHLEILSSGPAVPNPGELLTGARFAKILAWAEARYDQIVCDSPPVLAVSDCAIFSRLLDGVLLVVRADTVDRVVAARACDLLRSMNCPLLGVVVNRLHKKSTYGRTLVRNRGYYDYQDPRDGRGSENQPADGGNDQTPGKKAA